MLAYMKRGRAFYKDLFSLALPIVFQNLIMTALGIVDIFMVGLLGEAPMAAVTVANTPVFVIQLLVFGLQSGSAVLISQYWGKQNKEAINRVIGIGLYIAGTVSTLFALIMFFIPVQLMSVFSNNAELIPIAAAYARIVGFSYIMYSIFAVYTGAHRSMENPRLGLMVSASTMLVNTFLNWVLIFGNLGAPAMGVEGAAIATLISCVVGLIITLIHIKASRKFRLDFRLIARPGKEMVKEFIRYSTPVVINETAWGLGTALYPTIMGHMANSKEILAAHTVAGNIDKICTVAVFAVAATASVIVGREIGKGNMDEVYDVGAALATVAFIMGLVTGLVMLVILHVFIEPFIYPLFGMSPLSSGIATMMQTITFSFLAARSFNTTNVVGVLRGGGDVRAAAAIDIGPLWIVAIPMAAICGLVLKLNVIWVVIAKVVEDIVKFGIGIWRFRSKKWINDVTQEKVKRSEG